jgi:hypothetical protein
LEIKVNNYIENTNNDKKISIIVNDEDSVTKLSPKINSYISNELLYKDFKSFKTTGTTEITYQMISDILKNTYNFEESITSTALDIVGLYLKGHKILYTESKTLCEKRLHTLMLPAICISAISIVLSLLLREYQISSIVLSILSVINSIILSLVTYLKLDAKAEAHKISAYKYQKLESLCEFKSGRVLIFKDIDDIANILTEIETKVMEIKESNQLSCSIEISTNRAWRHIGSQVLKIVSNGEISSNLTWSHVHPQVLKSKISKIQESDFWH